MCESELAFVNSFAAIGGPVIVAIFVNGAFSIEEEAIAARLQSQRSIGAFVELVTVFRVRVQLETERFWARGDLHIFKSPNFATCNFKMMIELASTETVATPTRHHNDPRSNRQCQNMHNRFMLMLSFCFG